VATPGCASHNWLLRPLNGSLSFLVTPGTETATLGGNIVKVAATTTTTAAAAAAASTVARARVAFVKPYCFGYAGVLPASVKQQWFRCELQVSF
jgi:hypothetical protein